MIDKIITKCEEAGIKIEQGQAEQFERYYRLLIEWNEKINLTAITAPDAVITKHFVDSLLVLKAVEVKQGAALIDVGTGAGFPGIPLKILRPDIKLTLLDGLNKRLLFLQAVCRDLKLQAEFVHKRAEEAGRLPQMRERYDLATARAVAKMNTLCEYCMPLVKMKGRFLALKGPGIEEELTEAERAIALLGGRHLKTEAFILPDAEHSTRNIAVLQKIAFTPKEYPRHGNKIAKAPL